MRNVEQEADNIKRNSEESDVVLKNQQMIQQMVCDDATSWCKSNDDQLECKSNDNQQLVATVHSDESYSRRAVICIQSQRSRRNDNFSSSAKKSEVWTVAKNK
ncbi:hypothetical protein F511_08714 [Dorcoceras hygrometricum]|uniref:Uncharacterized protein n=1 Tax=Dorcoceras hygrometricum TaxID=472368 RepID=A0A2Z7BQJ0_9LAMI|nr:hypothetical protein F511_08714 [Dorcoceras hygrometricum]